MLLSKQIIPGVGRWNSFESYSILIATISKVVYLSYVKDNESIYNKERQRQILELLKRNRRITVKELVERFKVSGVSIRNDLNVLCESEAVVRTHGGAIYVEAFRGEELKQPAVQDGDSVLFKLVARAFSSISVGDVVYIDSNIPASIVIKELSGRDEITVVTNQIELAARLSGTTNIGILMLGGLVQNDRHTVQTFAVLEVLNGYNVSKAFFYPYGFTSDRGLTDNEPGEVQLKKLMVKHARESYCIVDKERCGVVSLGTYAGLESITAVIAQGLPEEYRESCETEGVRLDLLDTASLRNAVSHEDDGQSLFGKYRKSAMEQVKYDGLPGKNRRIGFANGFRAGAFCRSVEEGLIHQAQLAGFIKKNIFIRDNNYNPEKALQNAEEIIESSPDIFVEFQTDSKTNNIIATKLRTRRIPMIAVEVPIPGAVYIGVDNWKSALLAGSEAVKRIRHAWGGWDNVDLAVVFQMAEAGEATMLRSEGFVEALENEFGERVEEKIVRLNIGTGSEEDTRRAVRTLKNDYPDANRILMTSMTERGMREIISEFRRQDLWQDQETIIITHGCDSKTVPYIRDGRIDVAIAHFPELYGSYIIPAACALMNGGSVPPYIFVENTVIFRENIDQYYPDT